MTDPTCPHCGVTIGEHEANACLDRLVSETIFGVPFVTPGHGTCCTCQDCGYAYEECKCGYVTSIGMAWEVLEWLRDKDCDVALCSAGAEWTVESNVVDRVVRSKSAPLAICRAAVLAASEKEKT